MLLVPWHSMNFMCSTKGSEVVVSFWVGVVGTWEITVLNLLYFVEGSVVLDLEPSMQQSAIELHHQPRVWFSSTSFPWATCFHFGLLVPH